MQRLLMIMGVQRSGTNALFNCFVKEKGCYPIIDVESNEVYDRFLLRPEPQIRQMISDKQLPVLLKPVEETKKRSINSVFEEYRAYDLRILYIYRDPVNGYYSQIKMWPQYTDIDGFIEQWNTRNSFALEISAEWKTRLAIVKYKDLHDDPKVFDEACKFFGIPGSYLFRSDKNGGRRNLSPEIQKKIDDGTRIVLDRMDQARAFLPGKSHLSLRKFYRSTRFFLIEQLRKHQLLPQ